MGHRKISYPPITNTATGDGKPSDDSRVKQKGPEEIPQLSHHESYWSPQRKCFQTLCEYQPGRGLRDIPERK